MTVTQQLPRGCRTLRLHIPEPDYQCFVTDVDFARATLIKIHGENPELFPSTFGDGFVFNGRTQPSKKQVYQFRRLQVKGDSLVYMVVPVFVMPYMIAMTKDVEKPLFLRKFNVPFWGLTYVFGHNDMFWYRCEQSFGRLNIVGTTVKQPELLPTDLLADEKHTRRQGSKHFIAMTVANECILGAAMTDSASEVSLTKAYGEFANEARTVCPNYAPSSVNTDGWTATQKAWKACFPNISVILCFLHAFIKIRDRATKVLTDWFDGAANLVWEAYRAPTKASFAQRIRRLREWTAEHVPASPMKNHILDLCDKKDRFAESYTHEQTHRTSNMVDRLMKVFDHACFDSMYFHGKLESAEQRVRAWAILHNFYPYSPLTVNRHDGQLFPAERLNRRRYSDNWLENLLISSSMNGVSAHQQNPL